MVQDAVMLARAVLIALLLATSPALAKHNHGGKPPPGAPSLAGNEIFVGPFANWLCVRTLASGTCGPATGGYGTATGNGSTDDAAAIQASINSLSGAHAVLYFPPGTYRINATIALNNQSGMSLIGATPAPACAGGIAEAGTVCIVWGGAANSAAMLTVLNSDFTRVNRLTFNGNNAVGVLVTHNGTAGGGGEYADDVFINAGGTYNGGNSVDWACGWAVGATMLTAGGGCAETAILRDRFVNGVQGISTGNANAGDVWVWHSTFTNKSVALMSWEGDIHAFYNNFFNSSSTDIDIENPQQEQTFDFNYSSGSNQFLTCHNWANTATVQILQGNTVVNTTQPISIYCENSGPTILIDNLISSCTVADGCGSNAAPPAVEVNACCRSDYRADLFSTGNTYTVGTANACTSTSNAVYASQLNSPPNRCHAIGDTVAAHSHPAAPTLPGVPPQYCASGCPNTVSVQEVVAGASAATIQSAINTAAGIGNGAVVHLQGSGGANNLSTTLNVPGSSFIQIIGDGEAGHSTNIGAPGSGPAISCASPCKAWFRDVQLSGNGYTQNGLRIVGADQIGGRVFMEQLQAGNIKNGVLVNGLASANVEIHNSIFQDVGYTSSGCSDPCTPAAGSGIGVTVFGSGAGASSSYTNVFAALGSLNTTALVQTSGDANLTWRHLWYDAGQHFVVGGSVAKVSGTGSFTMAAGRPYLYSCSSLPSCTSTNGNFFDISNFTGISALIGIYTLQAETPANVLIHNAGPGNNLSLGYVGCKNPVPSFSDTATGGDIYALLSNQKNNPLGCTNQILTSTNVDYDAESSQNTTNPPPASFLNTTLGPLRHALPTVPGASGDPALSPTVTDVRIYRVGATLTNYAVDIEP